MAQDLQGFRPPSAAAGYLGFPGDRFRHISVTHATGHGAPPACPRACSRVQDVQRLPLPNSVHTLSIRETGPSPPLARIRPEFTWTGENLQTLPIDLLKTPFGYMVGAEGIEPTASSVSGKRSPTELRA